MLGLHGSACNESLSRKLTNDDLTTQPRTPARACGNGSLPVAQTTNVSIRNGCMMHEFEMLDMPLFRR